MIPVVLVHHHEITLKRDNRSFFEGHLRRNIRTVLRGIVPAGALSGGYGRYVLSLDSDRQITDVVASLSHVFGLANICPAFRVDQSIDEIATAALTLLEKESFNTIRVNTRRADKRFPQTSMEVNAIIGARVCTQFNVKADLTHPDRTVYVEIVDGVAYVYVSRISGAGGLPVGATGKVAGLLSAGFDSPVACWQLIRRGASVVFVHFHSVPYISKSSIDQVRELVQILTKYQFRSKLYLVPFAGIQQEIVLYTPQELRVILYRRMMLRIAESLARREGAEALVTGEAVGQVASQTLRNIRVIDEVANLPILRPLCGTDKEETMSVARRIGSYDISSQPFDDCCSFLAPRKPSTWASPEQVHTAEESLPIDAMIGKGMGEADLETFEAYAAKETTPEV